MLRRLLDDDRPLIAWHLPVDRRFALEGLAGVSVGPDGRTGAIFLAAGEGQDMVNHALRWDLDRGAPPEPLLVAELPLMVSRAAVGSNSRRLALPRLVRADEDPTWAGASIAQGVVLWSGAGSEELGKPFALAERCWPIAFHPDGRSLAITSSRTDGGRSLAITLWDVDERRPAKEIATRRHDVFDLAFAPSGNVLAVAAPHFGIELWDPRSGAFLHEHAMSEMFYRLAFSPDGERVAAGTAAGQVIVIVIDVRTGDRIAELFAGGREILDVAFAPEGSSTLAATCGDRIYFLDVDRAKQIGMIDLAALAEERRSSVRRGSLGREHTPDDEGEGEGEDEDEDDIGELDAYADELLGSPHQVVSMSWMESGLTIATGGGHVWQWAG